MHRRPAMACTSDGVNGIQLNRFMDNEDVVVNPLGESQASNDDGLLETLITAREPSNTCACTGGRRRHLAAMFVVLIVALYILVSAFGAEGVCARLPHN